MSAWDVFHSERLEVLRGLGVEEIRAAVAAGSLRDDDLARPAGTMAPWARLADLPGLLEPAPPPAPPPAAPPTPSPPPPPPSPAAPPPPAPPPAAPPVPPDGGRPAPEGHDAGRFEPAEPGEDAPDLPTDPPTLEIATLAATRARPEPEAAPPLPGPSPVEDGPDSEPEPEPLDPQEEDEAAAEFTLAPTPTQPVEELDLTAMVDVSFQLILFFLIAATAVYLKTLEIPEPNPQPDAAAAVQPRTIEDLESDYILVAIDSAGGFTVDHEPVEASPTALAARLRAARRDTGRTAMLLTAEPEALHRYAVLAYDAANEIGLRIAIARPTSPPPDATPARRAAPG